MSTIYRDDLISVITPLYNSEQYIEETIKSVISQTYQNWELLIIDDKSCDRGCEIVGQYTEPTSTLYDERIILLQNDTNMGVAYTRNRGIDAARGRYIAFLDSDDLWETDKLEKQVKFMIDTSCVFVYGSCRVIDKDGRDTHRDRLVPKSVTFKRLLLGNAIPCLTVMLDRNALDYIYMPDIPHEDYAAWLNILQKQNITAYAVDGIVASYRESDNSLSSSKLKAAGWTWRIYRGYLGLGITKSVFCFLSYSVNAVLKRCKSKMGD